MMQASDLVLSAACALLAWGVYRWTDHPAWALLLLAACTAGFIWYRSRQDVDD